jgi:riboflavin kinase/FMN adenylyltransferase
LFAEARRQSTGVAFTFEPHPGKVLEPDLAPKLITALSRKLELIAESGISAAIVQPFTREYARTPAAAFESAIFDTLGARHVIVGNDFTYGASRAGTSDSLARAALSRNASVRVVAPVTVDGVVVSSTKIREYILEGRVVAAQRLLGRYFDIDGMVVAGHGRGRSIGFPTANVDTENELRPAPGVYAVRVALKEGPSLFTWLPGAANIGVKPTFGGSTVTVEVHLIDFQGELYGRDVRVQFIDRLRPERRFGSPAELAAQIKRDVESTKMILARAFPQACA